MGERITAFKAARKQLRLVQGRRRGGGSGGFGDKAKQNPLYKTSLCKYYMMGKYCQFAGKCWYAHGQHELRGGRGGFGGGQGSGGFGRGGRGGFRGGRGSGGFGRGGGGGNHFYFG